MSEEIPYTKRYIYNLDPTILNSLETLYFDSLTFEQRTHGEFIERRKDELELNATASLAGMESFVKPIIVQPQPRKDDGKIAEALSRLSVSKPITEGKNTSGQDDHEASSSEESDIESESESESEPETEQKLDAIKENVDDDEYVSTVSFMSTKSPFVLFNSSVLPQSEKNMCFGIYKTSINAIDSPNFNPINAIRQISFSKEAPMPKDPIEAGMSAIFMLSSGHFAGAIISHLPHSTKGNKGSTSLLQLQSVRLLAHKTFHRYTTRRKQGGSQSAMDDSKGKANSAGSTLRRYNEQALGKDIELLMEEWKPLIDQSSSIFVRGSGKGGKNARGTGLIVRDVKDPKAIIKTGDKRVKMIPFATKRPTTTELKKAWIELSYLKIVEKPKIEKDEVEKRRKRDDMLNKSKEEAVKHVINESDEGIKITNEIISLLKKSKAPAFISYMKKNKIPINFKFEPLEQYRVTPTALHYASRSGISFMVQILLVQLHADPCIENVYGRTAYDICQDEEVKFAFRLARGIIGEDNSINWEESHVESGMTKEEVEESKAALKLEAEKHAKELKQEHDSVVEEFRSEQREKGNNKKQITGPGVLRVTEEQKLSGLSEMQRMKVLREQRFRAIEARLKKQQT